MRIAIALTLFASVLLIAPGSVSAAHFALGDHAAVHRALSIEVEQAGRKSARVKRKTRRYGRRYDWTARPYWRPYQYRYWKYYYPYGGPLF